MWPGNKIFSILTIGYVVFQDIFCDAVSICIDKFWSLKISAEVRYKAFQLGVE